MGISQKYHNLYLFKQMFVYLFVSVDFSVRFNFRFSTKQGINWFYNIMFFLCSYPNILSEGVLKPLHASTFSSSKLYLFSTLKWLILIFFNKTI